ncbi:MAG: DUF3365 domain-containing protein [Calditrichaeota bacterium]|nr:MAG: DUF3365 domain-containing protein [Calditrichota bacterium]
MKTSRFIGTGLLIFTLALGCGEKMEISQPSEIEAEKVQDIGAPLAKMLLDSLGFKLKSTLENEGPIAAINVCKLEALDITDRISANSENSVAIKRTTFKFRNPDNAPNGFEKKALEHFQAAAIEGGELPAFHIQKVTKGGETFFYFYKPMKAKNLCLVCHGDPANFDATLKASLQENYPADLATGYKDGDFRGLVSVKIKNVD